MFFDVFDTSWTSHMVRVWVTSLSCHGNEAQLKAFFFSCVTKLRQNITDMTISVSQLTALVILMPF